MDVKLANNLSKLEKMFGFRMCEYEKKLQKVNNEGNFTYRFIITTREFAEFKSFVWQSLSAMKAQIQLLCHETAMRRKVLLFHGLPEKQNENLIDVVYELISSQLRLPEVNKDCLKNAPQTEIMACPKKSSTNSANVPKKTRRR
ncbi:unnamed protein product [Parnassius apollo]|uniref:(apollo) hypothetical protein n=1 Tax=Parnassius apollo TaxID=110799 RepID=A0A8S3WKS7_PARAO|nr:unnamed protein product [Parnassius apollo]